MFLIIDRHPRDQIYKDTYGVYISDPYQAVNWIHEFCKRNRIHVRRKDIDVSRLILNPVGFHKLRRLKHGQEKTRGR